MAERVEKIEPVEQTVDVEAYNPLMEEYTKLGQEATQAEYHDMAEYYERKKQAIQEEQAAFNENLNTWKLKHTETTYGLPRYASGWEAWASAELRTNGLTSYYKYLTKQADAAWERERIEKAGE